MVNAMYFRRQAERLLALSRATIDLGIAVRLRALAGEFQAKADELDEEDDELSAFPSRRRGSVELGSGSALMHATRAIGTNSTDLDCMSEGHVGVVPCPMRNWPGAGPPSASTARTPRMTKKRDGFHCIAGFVGAGGEYLPTR